MVSSILQKMEEYEINHSKIAYIYIIVAVFILTIPTVIF